MSPNSLNCRCRMVLSSANPLAANLKVLVDLQSLTPYWASQYVASMPPGFVLSAKLSASALSNWFRASDLPHSRANRLRSGKGGLSLQDPQHCRRRKLARIGSACHPSIAAHMHDPSWQRYDRSPIKVPVRCDLTERYAEASFEPRRNHAMLAACRRVN